MIVWITKKRCEPRHANNKTIYKLDCQVYTTNILQYWMTKVDNEPNILRNSTQLGRHAIYPLVLVQSHRQPQLQLPVRWCTPQSTKHMESTPWAINIFHVPTWRSPYGKWEKPEWSKQIKLCFAALAPRSICSVLEYNIAHPQYLAYDGNWMHIFSPSQGTQMGSPNLESKGTHVLNGYSVPELTNPYIQCPIPSVNVDTESRISNIDMGWISDYVIR
jgi:hypothetical protein